MTHKLPIILKQTKQFKTRTTYLVSLIIAICSNWGVLMTGDPWKFLLLRTMYILLPTNSLHNLSWVWMMA